jgi:YVTN family beta-propeller protein
VNAFDRQKHPTLKTELKQQMKIETIGYRPSDALRSLASRKIHYHSTSAIRLGLAGLLLVAAAAFAAMSMQPPKLPWAAPIIPTGESPVHIMADPTTNTIYIAVQLDNTIAVVDGRNCNAGHTSKCTPIASISPGPFPTDLVLDTAHRTLFATLSGGNSDSIAVIDLTTCNATNTSGCSQTPKQVVFPGSTMFSGGAANVPFGFPAFMDLDETTHTLYVPDANEGPVWILDTSTCNGSTLTCSNPTVTSVNGDGVVVERAHHSVFVVQTIIFSSQVQIMDSSTCNSLNQSGCGTAPSQSYTADFFPTVPATVDEATHTVYMPANDPNILAVIDASVCNASTAAGCNGEPQVPVGSAGFAAVFDPNTKTVYVENFLSSSISVVNGATCNALNHSGCNQIPPILATGFLPAPFGYNPVTQTLYVSAQDSEQAWVLDGSRCNATKTNGCTKTAPITLTGTGQSGLDFNPNTKTVYIANQGDGTVAVVDENACNQHKTTGCNQTWTTIPVGTNPFRVAVNKATNTVYVNNRGDGTVSVINGATCNASVSSSCNQSQPTTIVSSQASSIDDLAIDETTNTIYVVNRFANMVAIVDGTHCQGSDSSGCSQTWPTFNVGHRPQALGFNPANHTLYIGNANDNDVSVVSTSHCNNHDTSDCSVKANVAVGDAPVSIAIVLDKDTVYVENRFDMSVSIFDGSTCNGSNVAGCPSGQAQVVSFAAFPNILTDPLGFGFGSYITGRQIAIDQQKHLVYIPTIGDSDLVVIDGNPCRADHINDCKPKIADLRPSGTADFVTVDPLSQTVYVTNVDDNTVSIFQDKY